MVENILRFERSKQKPGYSRPKFSKSHSTLDRLPNYNEIDALTPEIAEIMDLSFKQISDSKELRIYAKTLIDEALYSAKATGQRVDELMVKKIAETMSLSVNIYFLKQLLLQWRYTSLIKDIKLKRKL